MLSNPVKMKKIKEMVKIKNDFFMYFLSLYLLAKFKLTLLSNSICVWDLFSVRGEIVKNFLFLLQLRQNLKQKEKKKKRKKDKKEKKGDKERRKEKKHKRRSLSSSSEEEEEEKKYR